MGAGARTPCGSYFLSSATALSNGNGRSSCSRTHTAQGSPPESAPATPAHTYTKLAHVLLFIVFQLAKLHGQAFYAFAHAPGHTQHYELWQRHHVTPRSEPAARRGQPHGHTRRTSGTSNSSACGIHWRKTCRYSLNATPPAAMSHSAYMTAATRIVKRHERAHDVLACADFRASRNLTISASHPSTASSASDLRRRQQHIRRSRRPHMVAASV